jgi:UDP-N-acetylmuramate: L-alanyl-gamma-D-glutamyl-meso-diaminopimelate ligase
MDKADVAIVFYKEDTIAHKKLAPISIEEVKKAFRRKDLIVYTQTDQIQDDLNARDWNGCNLLLMSSGNFGGMDVDAFGKEIARR